MVEVTMARVALADLLTLLAGEVKGGHFDARSRQSGLFFTLFLRHFYSAFQNVSFLLIAF